MSRYFLWIIVSWAPISAIADESTPPLAESYLHQGKLAEGEVALQLALDANPNDDEARFGLGVVQFLRAIENLGQVMYEYGINSEATNTPFLRLPVPKNENPSSLTYRELGRVLDGFESDLSRAETTLAGIKADDVKLRLRLANIRVNFTNDEKQHVLLIDVLKRINGDRRFEFQTHNPDFRIHFDRGDVDWLRAYCHLLGAMVNFYRSVDIEFAFENRMRGIFPKMESTANPVEPDWKSGIKFRDAPRLRRARLQLIEVCVRNKEAWKHIRSEKDDDFEWLAHSKQKDQLGMPISDRQVEAWLRMLNELEQLLRGQALIPQEWLTIIPGGHDYEGRGLNLQKLLDDPPMDMFNLQRIEDKGIDPKYLEDVSEKKPVNTALLFQAIQLFSGPFGIAQALRMN